MEQQQQKQAGKYFLPVILIVFMCNFSYAQQDTSKSSGVKETKEYYSNGKVKKVVHKKGDVLHGESFEYNENGDLVSEILYDNGLLYRTKIYSGKKLIQMELYSKGKKVYSAKYDSKGMVGYEKIFNPDGESIDIHYEQGKYKSSNAFWSK